MFITLMTIIHNIGKGVNWLKLDVSTRGKVIYPPRERMDLDTDHVAKIVRGTAGLDKATTDVLGLLTSDAIKEQWVKSKCSLDDYENATRKKNRVVKYAGARPLYFEPAVAMTPGYIPVNIFYRMQTYCIRCRHLTYLLDMHYWCMRCTLLQGSGRVPVFKGALCVRSVSNTTIPYEPGQPVTGPNYTTPVKG